MDGAKTEYTIPAPNSYPEGIAAGPDGALWFVGNLDGVWRISTSGTFTGYTEPGVAGDFFGITAGPDGALWFTEALSNKIGRITTLGSVTEYSIPTASSYPVAIAPGPDGALWFVEESGNKIGRITISGTISEYPIPTSGSFPVGITAGPDGALWFTEYSGNKIGRVTTQGTFSEFLVPTAYGGPVDITLGTDGAIWFTEQESGYLGRITTAGLVNEFPKVTTDGNPGRIAEGPDGALWFAEVDEIGHVTLPLARPSVEPASGSGLSQTFTVRFTDAAGPSDISAVDILIGGVANFQNACYLAYVTSSETLYLRNDAGDGYAGALLLAGGQRSIQNSQCQVTNKGSTFTTTGTTLVLTLNVSFEPAFAGNQVVRLLQVNQSGYTSGWQAVGLWDVPGSPATQITLAGVDPARGASTGGIAQPLRFTITDADTYTNIGAVDILINNSVDSKSACYARYVETTDSLYLLDDAGTAWAGPIPLNGSGAIRNSQCKIEGAGSWAAGSGDTLTLRLVFFFYENFMGNQVVYAKGEDASGGEQYRLAGARNLERSVRR